MDRNAVAIGRCTQLLAVMAMYAAFLSGCIMLVNWKVPQPYLDEVFHYRQTIAYCNSQWFSWDAKITTPPALYASAVALQKYVLRIAQCGLPAMRWLNLGFGLLSIYSIAMLNRRNKEHALWSAFNTAILPISFFFHTLYYTDAGSLAFVLLALYASSRDWNWRSATCCAVSCAFRQTNIVWTGFIAANVLLRRLQAYSDRDNKHEPMFNPEFRLGIDLRSAMRSIRSLFVLLFRHVGFVARLMLPYFMVLAGFVGFLFWNGGIALGDKSNHAAVQNYPQMLYFAGFAAAHLIPLVHIPNLSREFALHCRRNVLSPKVFLMALCVGGFAYTAHRFTIVHPFLLADNRHFTFYIWKNIYARHEYVKMALAPVYYFAFWMILTLLSSSNVTLLETLSWLICSATAICFSPLLELRYFIVPYTMLRLYLNPRTAKGLSHETILFVLLNTFTLGLFLYHTFEWQSDPGMKMRFMW